MEKAITTKILTAIRKRGGYAVKQHGSRYSDSGVPDILACIDGKFIAIEVKQPGTHPTKIQVAHMDRISKSRGIAGVCRSVEDLDKLLLGS